MTPTTLSTLLLEAFQVARPIVTNEAALQLAIRRVLVEGSVYFYREHRLDQFSRPDFYVYDGGAFGPRRGIAIEVKVKGGISPLLRQVTRYVDHDRVTGILVVTTKQGHAALPEALNDKPVVCLYLGGLFV